MPPSPVCTTLGIESSFSPLFWCDRFSVSVKTSEFSSSGEVAFLLGEEKSAPAICTFVGTCSSFSRLFLFTELSESLLTVGARVGSEEGSYLCS